jgi:16S rRNA (guanine527-N7)-methyltransferase
MNPALIAELLAPFLAAAPTTASCHSEERSDEESAVLSPAQLHCISTYIDILIRWNARINLTAIRDPEEIVTRHFGESLFAARHLFPDVYPVSGACPERSRRVPSVVKGFDSAVDFANHQARTTNARLADLGSGAGFPGIPIKLWAPHIALTLIESNQKKAAFLREATRALTLTNVDIQNVRAETLPSSSFDVVTVRAVERFANILPTAATLLAPSGRVALLIASSQLETARSTLPQVSWSSPISISQSQSRIILVGHKNQ